MEQFIEFTSYIGTVGYFFLFNSLFIIFGKYYIGFQIYVADITFMVDYFSSELVIIIGYVE